jgi:hypothetical protein
MMPHISVTVSLDGVTPEGEPISMENRAAVVIGHVSVWGNEQALRALAAVCAEAADIAAGPAADCDMCGTRVPGVHTVEMATFACPNCKVAGGAP